MLLGGLALLAKRRGVARWSFAAGMLLLGVESLFAALAVGAEEPDAIIRWLHWKRTATSLLPGAWLVFSLSYSRGNAQEFLARWRPFWLALLIAPFGLSAYEALSGAGAVGGKAWTVEFRVIANEWFVNLGLSAIGLNLAMVMGGILILMNLERTFSAAVGTQRWRIKYLILGLGVLVGVRIYTASQILLFSGIASSMLFVESVALALCCVCVAFSVARSKAVEIDVYPSHSVLRHSATGVLAGLYLLAVGVFARLVASFGGDAAFEVKALLILLGVAGLGVILMSDRLRQRVQVFVARHFRRPSYDYRRVWSQFTAETTSLLDQQELARAVTRLVAETFNLLSVNVWLAEGRHGRLKCAASTTLTPEQVNELSLLQIDLRALESYFSQKPAAIDLGARSERWVAELSELSPKFFPKGGGRIVAPLLSGGELLGLLSVSDRVSGLRFTPEDYDLLKCIADQVAASLKNIALSRQLVQAKELEAFQAMSAFVVHDLKNTANTLSLMVQNMGAHFDKPEFRQDAIRGLSKSVQHITDLIGRLNLVRQKLEMKPVELDFNEYVAARLAEMEGVLSMSVVKVFQPVPRLRLDPEQFGKVLTNLLFNARDATDGRGEIRVSTGVEGAKAVLTVTDQGCGMTRDFLDTQLFKPFQTTKKKGLGIGLFHSRMIVESHRGRIDVQSELHKGTSFKILLPLPDLSQ